MSANLTFKTEKITPEDRKYHIHRRFSVTNRAGNTLGEVIWVQGGGWVFYDLRPSTPFSIQVDDLKEIVEFCDEQDEADNDDPGYEPPNCYVPGYGWTVV